MQILQARHLFDLTDQLNFFTFLKSKLNALLISGIQTGYSLSWAGGPSIGGPSYVYITFLDYSDHLNLFAF